MRRTILAAMILAAATWASAQDDPKSARTDAHGDPLPKGAITRIGTVRLANDGGITGLAFAPDGKSLASANGDNTVRLWETGTGKLIRSMKPPIAIIRSATAASAGWGPLAFAPDGKTIAAAGAGVCLWEVETGRLKRWLEGGQQMMRSIAFSADSKTLAAGFGDGRILVYEAATGKLLHTLKGHRDSPNGLAFLPDNKTLASTGHDGSTRIWDIEDGNEIHKFAPNPLSNSSLVVVGAGKIVISAGGMNSDGILRYWDLEAKKQVKQIQAHKRGALCLAISKDGKIMASGGYDRFIRFWDPESTAELGLGLEQRGEVLQIALSPAGDLIAWADASRIRIGKIAGLPKAFQFKELFPHAGHQGGIQSVAFSSDGKKILSQGEVAILWDEISGKELHRFNKGWRNAWSSDGKLLAFADPNDTTEHAIYCYDADTGKEVRKISAPTQVMSLGFTRDRSSIIIAGADGGIHLLELATGKVRATFKPGAGHLWHVIPAPDGYTVAAVFDKEVRVLDIISGAELAKVPSYGQAARFSPDGTILACRTYNDGILLWDLGQGKTLRRIAGRHFDIAFMPDGKTLVASGMDGTIRLWDIAGGKQLHSFTGQDGWILSIAVAPDGRTLVSGSTDTTLLLWPLDRFIKGKPVAAPRLSEKDLKGRLGKLPAGNVDDWWKALADADPAKAYRPMWGLVGAPKESLPIIEKWIGPICQTPIGELIADLDNADKREAATLKLERLGQVARPMLKRALQGKLSDEARRRIDRMLALSEADLTEGPDEGLRMLRTVEALEHIGTPEASALLAQIARAAPMPDAVDSARAALDRLKADR